ncbi:hypothetical protein L218DRAFT_949019 [Marasmius fiardii PR-910]|nr:hypothetical protein L218DRAFT_949019 [Marasmius fiardii PR-910]
MSRTLTFNYDAGQLTKDVKLILALAPTDAEIRDGHLAAQHVVELKAGGNSRGRFMVKYSADLGITAAKVNAGQIVLPEISTKIKRGQSTTLDLDGDVLFWSEPIEIGGHAIQAVNRTGRFQNIAIGTVDDQKDVFTLSPTLLLGNAGMIVETNFPPNLMMFVNLDCQLVQFLRWEVNLNAQDPVTNWNFEETPYGAYQVTPMQS